MTRTTFHKFSELHNQTKESESCIQNIYPILPRKCFRPEMQRNIFHPGNLVSHKIDDCLKVKGSVGRHDLVNQILFMGGNN